MAEDNQDLDMEDILSSIKNILEEDEQKQTASQSVSGEEDVLGEVLNTSTEPDDILELSPDMRIEETPAPDIIDVEAEPADDSFLAEDVSLVQDKEFDIGTEDLEGDSIFEADFVKPEPEPVAEFVEPEPEPVAEFVEPEPEPVAEFVEPEPEPVAEFVEPEPEPVAEFVEPEPEPVIESVADISEQVETSEPEQAELPQAPAPNNSDAIDVSANIISNFAKMFSREEPAPQSQPAAEVTAPGNTGKTLEEFVLDAIVKVIGTEISRQWNNGADFKSFAEAEIARQTSQWLNDNLPLLVEKIVKQEIERVIAKVGS